MIELKRDWHGSRDDRMFPRQFQKFISSLRCVNVSAMLLFLILSVLAGCAEKIKPTAMKGIDSRTLPQQESWNPTITISDSGKVGAIVTSDYLEKYDAPPQTLLKGNVVVRLFNSLGKQTSVITAKEGKVNEQTNDLEAYGNVLVVSSDSSRLWSERLFWNNTKRLIHTPDFVRIVTIKEKLQGYGFESDESLKNYTINRVTGTADTQ